MIIDEGEICQLLSKGERGKEDRGLKLMLNYLSTVETAGK